MFPDSQLQEMAGLGYIMFGSYIVTIQLVWRTLGKGTARHKGLSLPPQHALPNMRGPREFVLERPVPCVKLFEKKKKQLWNIMDLSSFKRFSAWKQIWDLKLVIFSYTWPMLDTLLNQGHGC